MPVVCREDYTIFLEQATASHTFIHCDVSARWTSSVLKRLRADFTTLLGLHGGPIRALHSPGDRKHHKFLSTFGFHLVASYTDVHGRPKEIYST